MKTPFRTVTSLALTLLLSALVAVPAFAAEKKEGEKKEGKARALPYSGTVKTVDKAGMTVTVATKEKARTFAITSETKISKGGKPATLDDVTVGEEAGISYVEKEGKFIANSLRAGAKVDAEPKAKAKKKDEDKK